MTGGTEFDAELAPLLVDAAPDGLVVADADGTIVFVNAATSSMFGWPRAELVGGPVERLLPERLRAAHSAHRARFAAEPRVRSMGAGVTLSGRRRDGSEFPVEISLSPVRTTRGLFVLASVRDVTERQRTTEALRRSELLLRELVDQAPDGIFVADLEGRYTDVNAAACRMLGFTREELIGKTIMDIIPPEEVPRLHEARAHLLTPGTVQVDEWALRRKDGVEIRVEVSAKILADGRWQAFVRDITERKRTEEALRLSEEHLRRAQRVAHLGSWDWDLRTNTIGRSPHLYELYGVQAAPESERPLAFLGQVPQDERDRVLRTLSEAIRAGRSYELEHRMVRPDGVERVLFQQGETFTENGEPVRCVGTVLDITDLRKAEREREAALRELEAVLEQCPAGITIVRVSDHEQRLENNRQARAMLGEPLDPAVGLSQYSGALVGFDGVPLAFEDFPSVRALRGERVERVEVMLRRRDGRSIPIEINAAPILDSDGRVTAALAVWQDITAAKELERLRAEWNSVVAHDLRQPISSINLYAQLLLRKADDWPAETRHFVLEIRKLVARLARMTGDLLDLSRLDASRLAVDRRPLDMAACVRESVERIALDADSRKFDVQVRGEIPAIEGDPDRLAQVMENLLTNAVKYGSADTPIRVSVEREGDDVAVSVTNEGAGVKPADFARLFQRFERAGVATHKAVPGIGLGLQITQGLVEAHGGRIVGESVPGGATTFRFTIPVRPGTHV